MDPVPQDASIARNLCSKHHSGSLQAGYSPGGLGALSALDAQYERLRVDVRIMSTTIFSTHLQLFSTCDAVSLAAVAISQIEQLLRGHSAPDGTQSSFRSIREPYGKKRSKILVNLGPQLADGEDPERRK